MARRAFSRIDLLALLAVLTVALGVLPVVGAGSNVQSMFVPNQSNLRRIGQAGGAYQGDFQGHLPLSPIWGHRGYARPTPTSQASAWSGWTYGGKNNSSFWYANLSGGLFDVEAADRPLNAYVYPGRSFYAPAIPARLPANDPARASTHADVFRDPADFVTRQRNWPVATNGVTCYDDVGTSYHTNGAWADVLPQSFTNRYLVGMGYIAATQHVTPSRFVWNADQFAALILYGSPQAQYVNGFEDINRSAMLFLDGHAAYQSVVPQQFNTTLYQFRFE